MNARAVSSAGLGLIKAFEGLRLTAYKCPAGVWTIGYGTTRGVKPGQVITEPEADARLAADVGRFARGVSEAVTVPLTQGQYDALVSLAYNIGLGAFRASTLLRRLNALDYAGAAAQFGRWNRAGGQVLAGLTRRREAERKLFEGTT